jgi:hypothetical protein
MGRGFKMDTNQNQQATELKSAHPQGVPLQTARPAMNKSSKLPNPAARTPKRIMVFLGPTLSASAAKAILPDALFLPPIRCGDILRVSRLRPDIIVIIDGYFENTPAVWHKEILYAMSIGIIVFGASSMGALRASELTSFGMRAFGDIASSFIEKEINDDDEVALLHSEHDGKFQQNSMAMVNIRATLAAALKQHIIDISLHDELIPILKKMHYRQRNLHTTLDLLSVDDNRRRELAPLIAWLDEYGMIDAKQQDTIQLLTYIANHDIPQNNIAYSFHASNLFRGLYKNIACRPFSEDYAWLPKIEQIALAARYLDDTYLLIRRLAYLLAACYQLALDKPHEKTQYQLKHMLIVLKLDASALLLDEDAAKALDCDQSAYQAFIARTTKIFNILANARYQDEPIDIPESYLILAMKIYDAYHHVQIQVGSHDDDTIIKHFRHSNPKRYQLLNMIAITWWYINTQATCLGLKPSVTALQQFSDQFRKRQKLLSVEALQTWLFNHNLNPESYEKMVIAMVNINYFAMQNQMDMLLNNLHEDYHWWFEDALYLSGYYHDAKHILEDASIRENTINAFTEKAVDDDYWLARDFMR